MAPGKMAGMRTALALLVAAVLGFGPTVPAIAGTVVPRDPGNGGPDHPRGGEGPEGSEVAFEFQDPRISESSGLAPSLLHQGVWWTHNDSGEHEPHVYAVDEEGRTLATVRLEVELRDWEAISVAEGPEGSPAIFVGDIGDNFGGGWPNIRVYRFDEPETLNDATLSPTVLTFTYEDGGRDAESMMIDPRDGRLYIASKEFSGGLYAAPEEIDPEGENVLERIDSAPLFATDAAFHPDGTRYAIRTYWGVSIYDSTDGVPGTSMGAFDLPEMEQGESVAFTPDGDELRAGTEGPHSPVWKVPLPDEYLDEERGESSPDTEDEEAAEDLEADQDEAGSAFGLILGGVAVTVVVIGGIVLLARKS